MGGQLPRTFGREFAATLSVDARQELVDKWARVKEIMIPGSHFLSLPLRRLVDSKTRGRVNDQIIDYAIGLEALLLHDVFAELSYRFSLRGATILSEVGEDKNDAFKKLKRFYRARSAIVHGGSVASYDLVEIAKDGHQLLKKIWDWYFSQNVTQKNAMAKIDRRIESE